MRQDAGSSKEQGSSGTPVTARNDDELAMDIDRRLSGDGRGRLRCGVCPRVAQAIVRKFPKICESARDPPYEGSYRERWGFGRARACHYIAASLKFRKSSGFSSRFWPPRKRTGNILPSNRLSRWSLEKCYQMVTLFRSMTLAAGVVPVHASMLLNRDTTDLGRPDPTLFCRPGNLVGLFDRDRDEAGRELAGTRGVNPDCPIISAAGNLAIGGVKGQGEDRPFVAS